MPQLSTSIITLHNLFVVDLFALYSALSEHKIIILLAENPTLLWILFLHEFCPTKIPAIIYDNNPAWELLEVEHSSSMHCILDFDLYTSIVILILHESEVNRPKFCKDSEYHRTCITGKT